MEKQDVLEKIIFYITKQKPEIFYEKKKGKYFINISEIDNYINKQNKLTFSNEDEDFEDSVSSIIDNFENKQLKYILLDVKEKLKNYNHIYIQIDEIDLILKINDFSFCPRSSSDCEVILHLYLKYGIHYLLDIVDGVFSFVLYDTTKNIIYVARDPYGVRPLYISQLNYLTGSIKNIIMYQ